MSDTPITHLMGSSIINSIRPEEPQMTPEEEKDAEDVIPSGGLWNLKVSDFDEKQRMIARRISHVLTYFPGLSTVMIQMGIGPNIQPSDWRPVLAAQVRCGAVMRDDIDVVTVAGRYKTFYRYRLATTQREWLDKAIGASTQDYSYDQTAES